MNLSTLENPTLNLENPTFTFALTQIQVIT